MAKKKLPPEGFRRWSDLYDYVIKSGHKIGNKDTINIKQNLYNEDTEETKIVHFKIQFGLLKAKCWDEYQAFESLKEIKKLDFSWVKK